MLLNFLPLQKHETLPCTSGTHGIDHWQYPHRGCSSSSLLAQGILAHHLLAIWILAQNIPSQEPLQWWLLMVLPQPTTPYHRMGQGFLLSSLILPGHLYKQPAPLKYTLSVGPSCRHLLTILTGIICFTVLVLVLNHFSIHMDDSRNTQPFHIVEPFTSNKVRSVSPTSLMP